MVRMLILFLTLIFSTSNTKSIFKQIWAEKVKIVMFMVLFPPDRLHYCDLGHCVPYVVFMVLGACNIIEKKIKGVRFA